MNITDKRKRRLLKDLSDKEYRSEYMSSSVDVGVASQIRALRDQRKWKQTDLAKKAKMHQVRISELENPSHSPTLATLKKIATAFDVALMVRFVPFSDLVKWKLSMSSESLEAQSFSEETFFIEDTANELDSVLVKEYYSENEVNVQGCHIDDYGYSQNITDISKYQQKSNPHKEKENEAIIRKDSKVHMAAAYFRS